SMTRTEVVEDGSVVGSAKAMERPEADRLGVWPAVGISNQSFRVMPTVHGSPAQSMNASNHEICSNRTTGCSSGSVGLLLKLARGCVVCHATVPPLADTVGAWGSPSSRSTRAHPSHWVFCAPRCRTATISPCRTSRGLLQLTSSTY